MGRRTRSNSDVGHEASGENSSLNFGSVKDGPRRIRSSSSGTRNNSATSSTSSSGGSRGWRKLSGAIQKINLGRMIDQMEDNQELADALEAVNAETQDEINFREIKREAEVACMLEVRKHLEVFVVEHPKATYEQWIMELHPDNINERVPHTIDHRFYVEDSDHRRLWNTYLTRGGGKRSYVHALSGDELPIFNHKQASFKNKRKDKDVEPADTHEANLRVDFDQYPLRKLHDDEVLDVDVSDPLGSMELSTSFTYGHDEHTRPKPLLDSTQIDDHDEDDDDDDYDGSHLFPQNPLPTNNNNDRSQSPPSRTDSDSAQNNHNTDNHEPDPYKDLGFDRDDDEDDLDEPPVHPQPQLHSKPHGRSRSRKDDHQPDPYEDLGFDRGDYDLDEPQHLFPPPAPPVNKDKSSSTPTPPAQDAAKPKLSAADQSNKPKSPPSRRMAPLFDTIETRLHLENHISTNPQCTYEHWIGELCPHLVSRDLTTGDVLILGEEYIFYDDASEFRRLWNIYLAKGGGRRAYVSARRFF